MYFVMAVVRRGRGASHSLCRAGVWQERPTVCLTRLVVGPQERERRWRKSARGDPQLPGRGVDAVRAQLV